MKRERTPISPDNGPVCKYILRLDYKLHYMRYDLVQDIRICQIHENLQLLRGLSRIKDGQSGSMHVAHAIINHDK
jgi:hypothetical protein